VRGRERKGRGGERERGWEREGGKHLSLKRRQAPVSQEEVRIDHLRSPVRTDVARQSATRLVDELMTQRRASVG
jgi:hypothetical protein